MHTLDEIWMNAPTSLVFRLAADVERWPEILPHYRWVRVISDDWGHRTVAMAARRGRIPVSWTAQQRVIRDERRITYHHIRGVTKGMTVEWRITEQDGGTHVAIEHDLNSHNPLLRTQLADWIVGSYFVSGIASLTLVHMKLAAESTESSETDTTPLSEVAV